MNSVEMIRLLQNGMNPDAFVEHTLTQEMLEIEAVAEAAIVGLSQELAEFEARVDAVISNAAQLKIAPDVGPLQGQIAKLKTIQKELLETLDAKKNELKRREKDASELTDKLGQLNREVEQFHHPVHDGLLEIGRRGCAYMGNIKVIKPFKLPGSDKSGKP